MALEYSLKLIGQLDINQIAEDILSNEEQNIMEHEKIDLITIPLYESQGFSIQIYNGTNGYYHYLNSKNIYEIKELKEYTAISFRFDKFFDNIKAKNNMLSFVIKILKANAQDALLLFNSNNLIFERTNGILLIDKKMDFWEWLEFDYSKEFAVLKVKFI